MKTHIIMLAMAVIGLCSQAQIKGTVSDPEQNHLVGASVYWKGSTIGVVTDVDGRFVIENTAAHDSLVISYMGYITKKIAAQDKQHLQIVLHPDKTELEDVSVMARDKGTYLSRSSTIQTASLSGAELCKAACCNLSESFTTNPSVDVSYADAATGAKQIRLLGLSGLYVQMMAENMPAFRGLASVYGLEYIPGAWMESIQVSKGAASVINGYEAISGQINVEYKKPEKSEQLFVNGFFNSDLKAELNVNSSLVLNEKLSTMVLGHFKDGSHLVDDNNDGFVDMPMIRQYNFINRWQYNTSKYMSQYGIKVINESRRSGQTAYYEDDPFAYGIDIETERYEFSTKQSLVFDKESGHSLALLGSGSYHKQNSLYGNRIYNAAQTNGYANLLYQNVIHDNPDYAYTFGASLMYDDYDEMLDSISFLRTELVPGIFGQYTHNFKDKLTMLAGLRADYHNEYGLFFTPRLHAKYTITEKLIARGSVGMGYRSVNVLAENSYLLASSRTIEIDDNLEQEQALNTGLSLTYYMPLFKKDATLSADYYYTRFYQQVVVDTDSDPHMLSIYNLDGMSYSQSLQIQAMYELVKGMDVTAAFRVNDVKMTIGDELREKPLTSRYKGLLTASYQTPLRKWQVDFSAQFNGGGRLPTPNGDLWETEYKPYTILNAQITKYFRNWNVYIGGENLTNFKMDNPIIDAANPWGENFDASVTWGPARGIVIYGGFRFSLDGKE